jgi:hypothetical protein
MEHFFVRLKSQDGRNELEKRLAYAKLKKLDDILPGDHCLVQYGGKNHRAMVNYYNKNDSTCFSVDTGEAFCFHDQEEPPIYKMSSKIRKAIPFEVIRCRLYGVVLPAHKKWLDFINATVLQRIDQPEIFIVHRNETSDDNEEPLKAMDEYEVILYDAAADIKRNINEILVKQLTILDKPK